MRGIEALKQLLKKKQRLEMMDSEGYAAIKKMHHCRNCKEEGHTILSCTKPCITCAETCCCRHLVKIENNWVASCTIVDQYI